MNFGEIQSVWRAVFLYYVRETRGGGAWGFSDFLNCLSYVLSVIRNSERRCSTDIPKHVCTDVPKHVCTEIPKHVYTDIPKHVYTDIPKHVYTDIPKHVWDFFVCRSAITICGYADVLIFCFTNLTYG